MAGETRKAGGGGSGGAAAFARHGTALQDALAETRRAWPGLGLYERFEQIICLVLTVVVSGVVMAALAVLVIRVAGLLLLGVVDPAEPAVFQAIFGMIVTVLIALLAIARKFLILDLREAEHTTLLGLAGAALALGGVYWLVGDQDRRGAEATSEGGGA